MPNHTDPLDAIFHALADSTRRHVLEQLTEGPATVGNLAVSYKMALPSFMQHLGVLERCNLIKSKKRGRTRTLQLVPKPLKSAETWVVEQQTSWSRRFDQMEQYLKHLKEMNHD